MFSDITGLSLKKEVRQKIWEQQLKTGAVENK